MKTKGCLEMRSFNRINLAGSSQEKRVLDKLASIVESLAEADGLSSNDPFFSKIEDAFKAKAANITKENSIPYDYAVKSGALQDQGLGVFTSCEDGKLKIWRVVNSESGPVIVRDAEREAEDELIQKLMSS